jgi:hypothetical protein
LGFYRWSFNCCFVDGNSGRMLELKGKRVNNIFHVLKLDCSSFDRSSIIIDKRKDLTIGDLLGKPHPGCHLRQWSTVQLCCNHRIICDICGGLPKQGLQVLFIASGRHRSGSEPPFD